ncbi:MAG: polysaccharide biosynthesis protein [Fimbriimonadales bacterium]|nr:polysaccharide biosynthesis protein [Fimbriimonadales bacterium]MDW8051126.1 nucleoside-diphosphate sugar epimerase/dehydratase [Armatimonadota bacterium]
MQNKSRWEWLRQVPPQRWATLLRAVATDVLLLSTALVLSVGLVRDFRYTAQDVLLLQWCAPLLSVAGVCALFCYGLYRVHSRYAGITELFHLLKVGIGLSVLCLIGLLAFAHWAKRPFSSAEWVLFGFLATTMVSAPRLWRRMYDWYIAYSRHQSPRRRALIVGGGDMGEVVMREIQRNHHAEVRVVGFVDNDLNKQSLRIHGYPWLGTIEDIPRLIAEHGIHDVIIADASADGNLVRRVYNLCRPTNTRVQIVPSLQPLNGNFKLARIREINIEDLLRRAPVQFDLRPVAEYIAGERVLITGAGGSIGSELARQIADFGPARLILLGKGENSIYQIEQELRTRYDYEPECIIADVRDATRIEAVFRKEQPTLVFHAAAHKHVPLMEANLVEAIKNNVLGTWVMAETAHRHKVRRFVYISTDKAVDPVSVMGATKRVGEIIVSSLARESDTEFAIVRFGNVLGSRGSLIPTLQAQIEQGGPVRITHPEMQRYFMSVNEAVHLILRVGSFSSHGDIYILDMGEPIRIVDLAHDLIRLYGLVPGQDIQIVFTGVRPGEKLHEQLCYDTEQLEETPHPKIRRVRSPEVPPWDWLQEQLSVLLELCEKEQADAARTMLMELATGKLAKRYSTLRGGVAKS